MNVDFAKIGTNKERFGWMFNEFSNEKLKVLRKLPVEKPYGISQYLAQKHWESLSKEQALKFDFAKLDGNQNKFNWIFGQFSPRAQWVSELSDLQLISIKDFFKSRADLVSKLDPRQKDLVK